MTSPSIVNIHFKGTNNVGDNHCRPNLYLSWLGSNVRHIASSEPLPRADWYVVGGGGLLNSSVHVQMRELANTGKAILWGAGTNYHGVKSAQWPAWLNGFRRVGLRDANNPWLWVPCVSCLNPFLHNTPRAATRDYVLYAHRDFPFPASWKGPVMYNHKAPSFAAVVKFLTQGETVITSTYHGAYWAQLLGRKVVVWSPFSSRFYHSEEPFVLYAGEDLDTALRLARPVHTDYLHRCLVATESFSDKVKDLIL